MKRTTLMLPDDLAALLNQERRRLDVSAAEVVRRALRAYFGAKPAIVPAFIGIGRSGGSNIAEEAEGILARALTYESLMGREPANSEDRPVASPANAASRPEAPNGLGTEAVPVVPNEVSA